MTNTSAAEDVQRAPSCQMILRREEAAHKRKFRRFVALWRSIRCFKYNDVSYTTTRTLIVAAVGALVFEYFERSLL